MKPLKIGIAVIQSLPKDEVQTGFELYNSTIKYITFEKEFLQNEFYDIECKDNFFKKLDELYKKAKKQKIFYFLHFEIHGNNDGVTLKNREFVSWFDLLVVFRKFNILYKNNLSIYLAICKGITLIKFIDPTKRSPFGFIIGSFKNINNSEIQDYFEMFYIAFFKKFSAFDAFKSAEKLKIGFSIITSQYIIDTILDLQKKYNDKDKIIKALNNSFSKINSENKTIQIIYNHLNNEVERIFNEYRIDKDYYLMND